MADKTIPALKILRGKVGINTATPSQQLHVNGEAYIFTGSTSVRTLSGIFKADTIENSAGASNLKLQTESGGNKHIEITPNGTGNVGINTNAPANKLEVNFTGDDGVRIQNTASSHASLYIDAGTGGVGNAYVRMTARDGTYTMTHWINLQSNGNLVFRPAATGTAANQIIFNQNGSVGVGGTPPSNYKFYVNGNAHLNSNVIIGDSDQQTTQLTIKALNTAGAPAATTRIVMEGYEGRGIGTFYTDSSYSGQEWFCGMNYSAAFGTWNVGYDASGGQAEYNANTLFRVRYTGRVEMLNYGSGTFTGTAAYKLAVDSSGNIIETAVGAGQVDGSGTANYISKWTDGDTLGNASIYDNGSNRISLGTINTSPWQALDVRSTGSQFSDGAGGNQNYNITVVDQNAYTSNYAGGILFGGKYNSSGGVTTLGIVSASKVNGDGNHGGKVHVGGRENNTATVPKVLTVTHANVGIGQVDPKADLHIGSSFSDAANDLATAALAIKQTGTSAENGIYLERTGERKGYYIGISGVDGLTFRRNFSGTKSDIMSLTRDGNVGINTTSPAYKLDVYGADARVGTNLRLGNGSAAGNSTNPAITVSGVTTAGVYFENSGVGFGAGSGSKYLFLSSAGNASLGGNGFFKQLGDRPYGTDDLNDYYRSNDEASFCQFYRYDATYGNFANSSGTIATNAPSTLTQSPSQIYAYGALFTLRSINNFRGQFYFAHSASEFYWRSGWGTNGDQNWTRIVGDRNIQSVINNVGNISIGGVSSNTARLHINETGTGTPIQITRANNSGNGMIKFMTGGTNDWIIGLRNVSDSDFHLYSYATATNVFSVRRSDGFVGIATDAARGLLEIGGTSTNRAARLVMNAGGSGSTNSAGMFNGLYHHDTIIGSYHDGSYSHGFISTGYGDSGRKFSIGTASGSTFSSATFVPKLTVQANGNVGIEDDTPENKLTVNGNSRFKDTMFFATTNRGLISWGTMGGGTGFGVQAASGNGLSLGANATWDHIVITTAGNVGIGRATAHGKLDILAAALGTSSGDVSVVSRSSSAVGSNTMYLLEEYVRTSAGTDWTSAGVRLQAKTDSTYQGYIQFNGDSNNYGITFGAGAGGTSSPGTTAERMRIDSTGNVGIASASPAATLDVKQGTTNNNNKLMKVADDVLSVYKVIGLSNHTVTLTCGSYFQAEVVITANQTNGGTYNNLYIRGIWSNNHTSHHWDEIENIGSLTGSSFSITVGQNDVSNSGKLTITHTYSSGSFAQMVVRVTDFYGTAHSYSIT